MPDYQGNAKNKGQSEKVSPDKPEKPRVEKITVNEVIIQKKSIGRKFKDILILGDFKSVVRYLGSDVLLPAVQNMIADAGTKGIERIVYGEPTSRRSQYGRTGSSRITYPYNNPINRGYSDYSTRYNPRQPMPQDPRTARRTREDFILSSREEAELVLGTMNDIIDQYDVVSVSDLNELVGYPATHVDNKWGWTHLGTVDIRNTREGWLLDFPPAEPIQ